jgi:hypothetical protein
MTARQLSREEILELPLVISLEVLGQVLGISEPTVRECRRNGDLEAAGIRVVKLGAQFRVVTASLHAFLGIGGGDSTESAGTDGAGQDSPVSPHMRSLPGKGDAA